MYDSRAHFQLMTLIRPLLFALSYFVRCPRKARHVDDGSCAPGAETKQQINVGQATQLEFPAMKKTSQELHNDCKRCAVVQPASRSYAMIESWRLFFP